MRELGSDLGNRRKAETHTQGWRDRENEAGQTNSSNQERQKHGEGREGPTRLPRVYARVSTLLFKEPPSHILTFYNSS